MDGRHSVYHPDAVGPINDEARFVVGEIDRPSRPAPTGRHRDLLPTNAQSCALELRAPRHPVSVVGGTRFWRAPRNQGRAGLPAGHSNPDDTVAARILNVPKRGIGAATEEAIAAHAARYGISFGAALRHLWVRAGCHGEGEGRTSTRSLVRVPDEASAGPVPHPPLRGGGTWLSC